MLVVEGFLENGVFTPNKPLADVKGRKYATLTVTENEEKERQERMTAWQQFGEAVINSGEELAGNPERFQFRTLQEAI